MGPTQQSAHRSMRRHHDAWVERSSRRGECHDHDGDDDICTDISGTDNDTGDDSLNNDNDRRGNIARSVDDGGAEWVIVCSERATGFVLCAGGCHGCLWRAHICVLENGCEWQAVLGQSRTLAPTNVGIRCRQAVVDHYP